MPIRARGDHATRSNDAGRARRPSIVSSRASTSSSRFPCSSVSTRRAANRVTCVAPEPLLAQRVEQRGPVACLLGEQHGCAHRGGPQPAVASEQAGQRLAHLRAAERLLREQRQLPAIERLAELAILVGEREPLAQVGGELRANLVEPRRLATRLRGRDRKDRRDPQGTEVEPLEDDGAGGDRTGRREPERGDGVGQLGGRIGRLGLGGGELAVQLENEQAVDVAPELGRHQAARLGPELRDLAGHDRPEADLAELDVVARREPDDRGERDVRARSAEQGLLEIEIRRLERLVLPVEPTAALGRPREHRQQDRAEQRIVAGFAEARVRAREDGCRRLAAEILDRVARIGQPAQRRRLLLDEPLHERAVLVERRAVARRVLLERERHLRSALGGERGQAERAQGLV